jgi:sugar diacid utilization regulator
MNAKIPHVSGKLREDTLAMAASPQELIDRCYAALKEEEGDYAQLSSSTRGDVIESIRQSAALWFDAILSGKAPSEADVEQFSLFGRKRVHQGIDLTALLGAFRLGSRELWNSYLALASKNDEVRDQLLFEVTPYLLDHFGKMVQSIAEAYLDEQYQQSRRRDVLRYELCNIVFSDAGNVAEFNRIAEAIALDPTVPRVAMAFETNLPISMFSRVEAELDNVLVRIARVAKVDANDLVRVIHRERFVVWMPCIRGDSILASDRRMHELAERLIESVGDLKLVGVGMMGHGPAGWLSSVDEALKALELGARTDSDAKVFRYSDIALREGARRADNVLRYLESLIERLSHDPELLRTLECYLDQFQRRKQTAAVLGIHPNTLNYRLDRIQEMTGSNLEDPGWLAKLHVAVKLRRGSLF